MPLFWETWGKIVGNRTTDALLGKRLDEGGADEDMRLSHSIILFMYISSCMDKNIIHLQARIDTAEGASAVPPKPGRNPTLSFDEVFFFFNLPSSTHTLTEISPLCTGRSICDFFTCKISRCGRECVKVEQHERRVRRRWCSLGHCQEPQNVAPPFPSVPCHTNTCEGACFDTNYTPEQIRSMETKKEEKSL